MNDSSLEPKSSPVKWIFLIVGLLAVACLVVTVGGASFFFGQASVNSSPVVETVTVTEYVEVTRVDRKSVV